MGNRAVITTKEHEIGVYLHWSAARTRSHHCSGTASYRATAHRAETATDGRGSAR